MMVSAFEILIMMTMMIFHDSDDDDCDADDDDDGDADNAGVDLLRGVGREGEVVRRDDGGAARAHQQA